ncbi:hypothetical protein JOM56_010078 [Amanita muscaria]
MSFLLVPALGAPFRSHTPPPPYSESPPPHRPGETPPPSYHDPLGRESPPPHFLPSISSVIARPPRPRGDSGGRRGVEYNPARLYTGDSSSRPQKRNNTATVDLLSEEHIAPAEKV